MKKMLKGAFKLFGVEINKIRTIENNEFLKLSAAFNVNFKTVFDIGANEGQFAINARKAFPNAKIISFEPIRECFDVLEKLFANDSEFIAFNVAIGKSGRNSTFFVHNYSPASSLLENEFLLEDSFQFASGNDKVNIMEYSVFDLVENKRIEKPYLVKLDVQGYELEVINNNFEFIKSAEGLLIEVSFRQLYKRQPLFRQIYSVISIMGFEFMGFMGQLYLPKTFTPVQGDAIFIKN